MSDVVEICEARRPGRGDEDCDGPVAFEVVYRSSTNGRVFVAVPGCFRHAMAELDRTTAAGTIARVDVEPRKKEER